MKNQSILATLIWAAIFYFTFEWAYSQCVIKVIAIAHQMGMN